MMAEIKVNPVSSSVYSDIIRGVTQHFLMSIPAAASGTGSLSLFDWVHHGAVWQGPADLWVGKTRSHTVHLQVCTVDHLLTGSLLLPVNLGRSGQNTDPQLDVIFSHLVPCNTEVVTAVLLRHRMDGYTAVQGHLDPGVKTAQNSTEVVFSLLYDGEYKDYNISLRFCYEGGE